MSTDTSATSAGTSVSNQNNETKPQRPAPLRRKSTLLLQGEHEPEVDEDMEFHRLNLAPGVQPNTAKPLSRAGSGDEIQLGENYPHAGGKLVSTKTQSSFPTARS